MWGCKNAKEKYITNAGGLANCAPRLSCQLFIPASSYFWCCECTAACFWYFICVRPLSSISNVWSFYLTCSDTRVYLTAYSFSPSVWPDAICMESGQLCKAKRQYLLTRKVSRYRLLALRGSVTVTCDLLSQKSSVILASLNLYSAGIGFGRQNMTSVDVIFWHLKPIPALKEMQYL